MNVTGWEVLLIRLLSGILQPQSLVTEVMGSSSSQPTTTLSQEAGFNNEVDLGMDTRN